jgi:hypothetical protein
LPWRDIINSIALRFDTAKDKPRLDRSGGRLRQT